MTESSSQPESVRAAEATSGLLESSEARRSLERLQSLYRAEGLVALLMGRDQRVLESLKLGEDLSFDSFPTDLGQVPWLFEKLGDKQAAILEVDRLADSQGWFRPHFDGGSVLLLPFSQGELAGGVLLFSKAPGHFDGDALESGCVFLERVLDNLENAIRVRKVRARNQQLIALTDLIGLVALQRDLPSIQAAAIDIVVRLIDCEAASLIVRDPESRRLRFEVAVGEKKEDLRSVTLDAEEGIAGKVIREAKPFFHNRVEDCELHSKRVDSKTDFQTRSVLAVPLVLEGEVLGCLQALNSRAPEGFDEEDQDLLEALGLQISIAVQNARLNAKLSRQIERVERQQEALVQTEKLSAMGQLAAGIAHEIRSPLSAISGYAQLLQRRIDRDEDQKPLRVIEEAANHINSIVNGLLDFARKEEPESVPLDVHEILEGTLKISEGTLRKFRNVVVERKFQEGLPPLTGDRRQLQQVFLQLILNGAQAMPKGGTLVLETFGEAPPGAEDSGAIGRVVVLVRDQGVGIPEYHRDKVFQPFFTFGKDEGTGLGLSVCRSIVQKHRGVLTFESEEGKGTTFRAQFPVERSVYESMREELRQES